jgi:hypothetical protein
MFLEVSGTSGNKIAISIIKRLNQYRSDSCGDDPVFSVYDAAVTPTHGAGFIARMPPLLVCERLLRMITRNSTVCIGRPVSDAPDAAVSARRGGNRLSLLAMVVPLLLLAGMSLTGVARQLSQPRLMPGSLAKSEIETAVYQLAAQLTAAQPEILSTGLQVAYSVHREKQMPEWSVLCRAGQDYYLFRVNGKDGKVFGINRLDDPSGQGILIRPSEMPIKAGLTLPMGGASFTPETVWDASGKAASEAKARRYLPILGIYLREINGAADRSELAHSPVNSADRIWTFTYFLKSSQTMRGAIRVSVESGTGKLHSYWNPAFSL